MNDSTLSCPAKELDDLTRLELTIARRADELSRRPHTDHPSPDCWQEAEREIWSAWLSGESTRLAC